MFWAVIHRTVMRSTQRSTQLCWLTLLHITSQMWPGVCCLLTVRHQSNVGNKCASFSATVYKMFEPHLIRSSRNRTYTTIMAERIHNSLIMKIQDGGGRHIIDFRKMSISPGQTAGNNWNTAFSLHVVESASDEYNLSLIRVVYCTFYTCKIFKTSMLYVWDFRQCTFVTSVIKLCHSLPREAMHAWPMLSCGGCVSVCLCVCLSRSWILSEQVFLSLNCFHRRIAKPF